MEKKLISLNLMKTRKVKKSNFKIKTVVFIVLISIVFLAYNYEILNMI